MYIPRKTKSNWNEKGSYEQNGGENKNCKQNVPKCCCLKDEDEAAKKDDDDETKPNGHKFS